MSNTNRVTTPAYTLGTLLLIQAAALAAHAIKLGDILHGIGTIITHGDFTGLGGLYEDHPIVDYLFAIHDVVRVAQDIIYTTFLSF